MVEFVAWIEVLLLVVALGVIFVARGIFHLILGDMRRQRDGALAEVARLRGKIREECDRLQPIGAGADNSIEISEAEGCKAE